MRAVIQRVVRAGVTVDGAVTGEINRGLVVFLGVEAGDSAVDLAYIADKAAGLRIFEDSEGKMNLSVKDVGGEILAISQFTILGDVRKGKRPSFTAAAGPDEANEFYRAFVDRITAEGIPVSEGVFRAEMLVRVDNDGPVTILLDSRRGF